MKLTEKESMSAISNVEILINNVIKMIHEDSWNDAKIDDANLKLKSLQEEIEKSDDMFLKIREHLISKITQTCIWMHEENESDIQKRNSIIEKLDNDTNDLFNWIIEMENVVEELLIKSHKTSSFINANDIKDLLCEMQKSFKMTLSFIHEINSSMIDLPKIITLLNNLSNIKERNIICSRTLLELFAVIQRSQIVKDDDTDINIPKLEYLEMESACLNWNNNLQTLIYRFASISEEISGKISDMGSQGNECSYPTDAIFKIDARLDCLTNFIHENMELNYEGEIELLINILPQISCDENQNDNDILTKLEEVKVKLASFQILVKSRCHSSSYTIGKNQQDKYLLRYLTNYQKLFSEKLENYQNEYSNLSIDFSNNEKIFMETILTPTDNVVLDECQNESWNNEKLNQYNALLRLFNILMSIVKFYVTGNRNVFPRNNEDINLEINNIKNIMMTITSTISMIERYQRSLENVKTNDEKIFFNVELKQNALSLLDEAIKKIIENERDQKLCELLQDLVDNLAQSVELEISSLVMDNIWNEKVCKILSHRVYWLLNIWQSTSVSKKYFILNEKFQHLVELMNSLNKEQYACLQKTSLNKESSREYWFGILQDWQNNVEFQTTSSICYDDNSYLEKEWNSFRERMHLICEFQQIDANIDHYGIEFETDFLDVMTFSKIEMDKANKLFFDKFLDKTEQTMKFLQFISRELNELQQNKQTNLSTLQSSEGLEKSNQISLQILEYIHSLLDKIGESQHFENTTIDERIRSLQVTLHSLKKSLLIQNNYFQKFYENHKSLSAMMNNIEDSLESITVFLEMKVTTLAAEAFMEMLNKCQETLFKVEADFIYVESQLYPIDDISPIVIVKANESIQSRILSTKQVANKIKFRIQNAKLTLAAVIEQQDKTNTLRIKIQIFMTKIDIYFTNIDFNSIISKEIAENYVAQMNKLLNDTEDHLSMVYEIEAINNDILKTYPNSTLLKAIFERELTHLMDSLDRRKLLRESIRQVNEKGEVLAELDRRVKTHFDNMDKLKTVIINDEENHIFRLSQEIETIRFEINKSVFYMHDAFKGDKSQMERFSNILENLEVFLDLYDDLIVRKKKSQNQRQKVIDNLIIKKDLYTKNLNVYKEEMEKIINVTNHSTKTKDFICKMEIVLNEAIKTKNEILNDSLNIYVSELQNSEILNRYQDFFGGLIEFIKTCSSMIIHFLMNKYFLSCTINEVFYELCLHWTIIVKDCLENTNETEYHNMLSNIETIKVIIECLEVVADQSYNCAITERSIVNMESVKSVIANLTFVIDDILKSTTTFDNKLTNFYLLRYSFTKCADKLYIHQTLVESLYKISSVQKNRFMNKQFKQFWSFIQQQRNKYHQFEKLCESILEENLLGFDMESDIQTSLENVKEELDNVRRQYMALSENLNKSIIEWDSAEQKESVTEQFLNILDESLRNLIDGKNEDKFQELMYLENMKMVIDYLEENEFHRTSLKGYVETDDRQYFQQRISINSSCINICHMITDFYSTNVNQCLVLYNGLSLESNLIKFDLLKLIKDLTYFYLGSELTPTEKECLLEQREKSLVEIEKSMVAWHSRSNPTSSDIMHIYHMSFNAKWDNLQKWFEVCSSLFNNIFSSDQKYISIYRTLQLKINIFGVYSEKAESCDHFVKNNLSKCSQSLVLQKCLNMSEILLNQMGPVNKQLETLKELKTHLQHLTMGQNGQCDALDSKKISEMEEVMELITKSQLKIKEKLSKIIHSKSEDRSIMISSFSEKVSESDNDDEDRYTLLIEKDNTSVDRHRKQSDNVDDIRHENPLFSFEKMADKYVNDLIDIFTKVLSTNNEQEAFLQEEWKNISVNDINLTENINRMEEDIEFKPFISSTHNVLLNDILNDDSEIMDKQDANINTLQLSSTSSAVILNHLRQPGTNESMMEDPTYEIIKRKNEKIVLENTDEFELSTSSLGSLKGTSYFIDNRSMTENDITVNHEDQNETVVEKISSSSIIEIESDFIESEKLITTDPIGKYFKGNGVSGNQDSTLTTEEHGNFDIITENNENDIHSYEEYCDDSNSQNSANLKRRDENMKNEDKEAKFADLQLNINNGNLERLSFNNLAIDHVNHSCEKAEIEEDEKEENLYHGNQHIKDEETEIQHSCPIQIKDISDNSILEIANTNAMENIEIFKIENITNSPSSEKSEGSDHYENYSSLQLLQEISEKNLFNINTEEQFIIDHQFNTFGVLKEKHISEENFNEADYNETLSSFYDNIRHSVNKRQSTEDITKSETNNETDTCLMTNEFEKEIFKLDLTDFGDLTKSADLCDPNFSAPSILESIIGSNSLESDQPIQNKTEMKVQLDSIQTISSKSENERTPDNDKGHKNSEMTFNEIHDYGLILSDNSTLININNKCFNPCRIKENEIICNNSIFKVDSQTGDLNSISNMVLPTVSDGFQSGFQLTEKEKNFSFVLEEQSKLIENDNKLCSASETDSEEIFENDSFKESEDEISETESQVQDDYNELENYNCENNAPLTTMKDTEDLCIKENECERIEITDIQMRVSSIYNYEDNEEKFEVTTEIINNEYVKMYRKESFSNESYNEVNEESRSSVDIKHSEKPHEEDFDMQLFSKSETGGIVEDNILNQKIWRSEFYTNLCISNKDSNDLENDSCASNPEKNDQMSTQRTSLWILPKHDNSQHQNNFWLKYEVLNSSSENLPHYPLGDSVPVDDYEAINDTEEDSRSDLVDNSYSEHISPIHLETERMSEIVRRIPILDEKMISTEKSGSNEELRSKQNTNYVTGKQSSGYNYCWKLLLLSLLLTLLIISLCIPIMPIMNSCGNRMYYVLRTMNPISFKRSVAV